MTGKRIVSLSLFAAVMLQTSLVANDNKKMESLGSVEVLSTDSTIEKGSYTVESMNTSTKLDLSIRNTPQSVSVFTKQKMEDLGIDSIEGIVKHTTGLSSMTFDSERRHFSARGFLIDSYQIDGIPTTWTSGWSAGETSQDLTIYERVEVVRGATGLMSGAGNPSAAINLVRKKADSKEFKGEISLKGGSWNTFGGEFDVSTPLTESKATRARVSGKYEKGDSYIDSYKKEKNVLYGVVESDITDNTQVSAGISYQKNDPKGSMWGGLPAFFSNGNPTNWDVSKTNAANWTYWKSENLNYFANVEHLFDNGAKINGSYSRISSTADLKLLYMYGSLDQTNGTGLNPHIRMYDVEKTQDTFDLYSSIPLEYNGLEHELVAGLTHSTKDLTTYSRTPLSTTAIGNFYNWNPNTYPEPQFGAKTLSTDTTTEQSAAYLVGKISLSEKLKLVLGSRITNWKADLKNGTPRSFDHNSVVTPYAGIIYDINENHTAYASYTDIFNPQDNRDKDGNYLDPVEGVNYEVGVKGSYFEDSLNASLAVFRIRQDNLAQKDPSGAKVVGTSDDAYVTAKGVESEGFELEVNGEISNNWAMSFGFSQFVARDAQKKDVNTNHPRKTAKLFTTYKIDKLTLGGGVNWQGETYQVSGTNRITQKSYSLVNAMAKYDFSKNLSAQLNVDNVFNKKYYSNVGFFSQVAYGAPRNAMVKLKYTF